MSLDVMFGRVYKTYFSGMAISFLFFPKATNFDLSNADINNGHLLSLREIDTHGKATRFGRTVITFSWVFNMLFLQPLRESFMRQDEAINRRLPRKFETIPEGKKPQLSSSFYFFG